MAAPSYTTDLIDWILDGDITAWTELTNATSGGAPDEADTESALQGTNSVSQITNTTALCSMIRILATPITLTAGQVFLMWHGHGVATALSSYANGGLRTVVSGNAVGNWKAWAVGGNDVAPFPYSKWVSTPIDPTVTADYTNGTPPTNATNIFGVGSMCLLTQAVARGQPHIVDIIRYGRAESRFNGGDLANGYATFQGFATENDTVANRWGLIQATTGGYQWKGLMVLGHASAVDFRYSNASVFVQDCRKVSSGFNRIEIRQAGSRVDWNNISFVNVSPDTNASRGDLQVVDNATVNIIGCSFTDLGTFSFLSNSVVTDTVFRRCQTITHGNSNFTSNRITNSVSAVALVTADPSIVQGCTFVSSGTGHAIEITTPGSYAFVNNNFSGYGASNTTDAAVYNNSGGLVTLNVTGGGSPTFRNSVGSTTDIVASYTVQLTGLKPNSEVRAYTGTDPATAVEIAAVENSTTSFTFGHSVPGVSGYIQIFNVDYQPILLNIVYASVNAEIPIQQIIDRVYSNPA